VTPSRPLYRIQAVARATNVSEHALRVWERRYSTLSSHRSPAGYRLYTDEDIAKIRTIKELLDQGHAVGEIAALSFRELERLRDRSRGTAPSALPEPIAEVARRRFLDAIDALDPEEASRVTAASIVAFPPFELVNSVFGPLLQEIGDRWEAGTFTVAQEHAASAVIRGHLAELLRMQRPADSAPAVIATTPTGELHEFGALLAAVAASTMGARVIYLGPNTPNADIASAAKSARARAVIFSVVCAEAAKVVEVLTSLRRAVPKSIAVWAGGRAVTKQPPTGVTWARSLEDVRTLAAGL
jgi:DNA-binding transcriptional MerR regulator/methylmalonyl-CoA mutase cobalamin-binding subunit